MLTRLCFAVHCHQPVGNFPWVLQEAYTCAYQPFLKTLERHPQVRMVFHYSGVLLDWLKGEHPEFLGSLKALVRRGQVEFLGGGYYEPILPLIPPQDAWGQIAQMNQTLQELGLDAKAGIQGAWLTERIWEPQLPSVLSRAGIRYTVVDDRHLEKAGIPEEKRFGFYLTEDQGLSVAVFPSLKTLRYLVPFKPVEEVIEALRRFRSEDPRVVVLADDGEKFGLWPGTNAWVYQEGWLESFFRALEENRQWLKLMTFQEALTELPPLGEIYLPCGSYEEMEGWSGGLFRNFLARYPEANAMHKKMLWVSDRLERLASSVKRQASSVRWQEARQHLYMAQDNDAYWHGIFGGLYLRHLRRSVWAHLLKAEEILDQMEMPRGKSRPWIQGQSKDFDADERKEILLRSPELTLLIDPNQGGQLIELSDKGRGLNLLDTMTRRPEAYHARLSAPQAVHTALSARGALPGQAGASTPLSIHEQEGASSAGPGARETALADLLVYDPYRRAGLIDHLLDLNEQVRSFSAGGVLELGDFFKNPYQGTIRRSTSVLQAILTRKGEIRIQGAPRPLRIRKVISLKPKGRVVGFAYQLTNYSADQLNFLFGSEFNLNLKDSHVNRVGEAPGVGRFTVTDPAARWRASWILKRKCQLWYFPLETLSDSERGIERTYQGVCLCFLWPVTLSPQGSWSVKWELQLESL